MKLSSQAAAAKAIRAELKKAFPGQKFYVTSSGFSMGDSVDIRYIDGPTSAEVEAVTNKYQYGHFNSMEDIYENSNRRDDIPQSKYVGVSRKYSNKVRIAEIERINKKYDLNITYKEKTHSDGEEWLEVSDFMIEQFNTWSTQFAYRELYEKSFYQKPVTKKTKVKKPVKKVNKKYSSDREELEALRAWEKNQQKKIIPSNVIQFVGAA